MPEVAVPSDSAQRGPRRRRWAVAITYTLLLYTLAWFVNPLWLALTRAMGTERGGYFVDAAVPAIGLAILALLLFRRLPTSYSYLWLLAIAAGYAYVLTMHAEYPVERIHLLQYSLVAFFYYRALRADRSQRRAYLGAALAVIIIGFTDELIQEFLIPRRSGTVGDIGINWFSGGLGLLGLMAVQPDSVWPVHKRLRPTLRWATGVLLPLALTSFWSYRIYTGYINPPLNLLIITVDCARPDFWGLYGHKDDPPTTEWLDLAAAQHGATFTHAYSQAAWTSPGVASVLTGLYPPTHGVTSQDRSVPRSVVTLLDAFKDHGYTVPQLSFLINAAPNFLNFADFDEGIPGMMAENEAEQIVDWIGDNHRKPFALWYHWRYMHLPYNPPEVHWLYPPATLDQSRVLPLREAKLDPRNEVVMPPALRDLITKEVIIPYYSNEALAAAEETLLPPSYETPPVFEFPEGTKEWIDALYKAQTRHFDRNFEKFRYKLALHHKLQHTIIVITADHSEELLEHGFIGHASTAVHSRHYDELLHIPLVILAPKLMKQGRVIDTMAEQVDVMPTILDMMGWDIPPEVQGRSLWPAMRGEAMPDQPTFAESIEGGYQSKPYQRTTFVRSVRTKDWKLIARTGPRGDALELYDLKNDPNETRNVHVDHPEVAASMLDMIGDWVTRNAEARAALDKREEILQAREAALDPENLSIPEIVSPKSGDTLHFETNNGAIQAEWTGNEFAAYIIEYDIGEGWHRLQGTYPVEEGTKHLFGPVPRDGWKPLYQWNPYRLRIRPRDLPNGWSDWITVNVAPLTDGNDVD